MKKQEGQIISSFDKMQDYEVNLVQFEPVYDEFWVSIVHFEVFAVEFEAQKGIEELEMSQYEDSLSHTNS